MPNFTNSVIYKIHSTNPDTAPKVYIGSTTHFRRRKCAHKTSCINESDRCYNYPVYRYIRDHGGWNEWFVTQVKEYPCNSKRELEAEERRVMLEIGFEHCLNKIQPTRTKQEYYEQNKEQLKQHYEQNKERLKQKYDNAPRVRCAYCDRSYHKTNMLKHTKTERHRANYQRAYFDVFECETSDTGEGEWI